ncbi:MULTISPECIES: energy-coupling factor transporter transmembrane component T family protein [Nocardiopsidaceae]|uniref:Energy-coupling factor transporter transmembrane protein EcfT n=2 Tax=Nocardiopsidaceae TaxID=83676 RepID=A0ABY6YJ80_9ACTN|nr:MULTISPECIES: energy-coupling factor transporter transmembrane protein EcfT [Nocardiopsaceae]MEE2053553.1 energy-coupling factor transporter transmembrane protein EcfT [Nocardiopsis umidischolae]WAE72368.1 energy-coupling factor transporter transmembrane protein EcfT [Streptomonospora nanhaiensis]
MSAIGLYVPGTGPLYRAPAWAKLLGLLAAGVALLAAADHRIALGALAASLLAYPVVGLAPARAWGVLRVLWPFLLAIALFQVLFGEWETAVRLCAQLAALVLLANVVTLTTRVREMLDLFERVARPLRHVGVAPDRVALVLALTIRSIPMVADAWRTSQEAYRARGLSGRPHLLVVPVIVQLLRMADATGEALVARGIDDDTRA